MYKGVELPNNYNDMPLHQKEALWLGMLLVYESPVYFDDNYWVDEIVNASELVIFEDDIVALYKCYNDAYKIKYKTVDEGITASFDYFFCPDEDNEYANMESILGDDYKDTTIRDYIRSKGFPITAEFWKQYGM